MHDSARQKRSPRLKGFHRLAASFLPCSCPLSTSGAGSARYRLMKHLARSAFCASQDGIRVVPRAHSSLGANVLFLRSGRFIHGDKKEYEEDAAKPIIDDNDA